MTEKPKDDTLSTKMIPFAAMKKLAYILALFLCLSAPAAHFVWKVSDGDTVWTVDDRGEKRKIRLSRIDAPEMNQPYGRESADYLASLVLGKEVEIESAGKDRYGRSLDILYIRANGAERVDVNLAMVKGGYAWHYSHTDKTPAYINAQKEAQAAHRGLWQAQNPVNPYEYRKRQIPPAPEKEYSRRKVAIPARFLETRQGKR